jgi:hypothetical protein
MPNSVLSPLAGLSPSITRMIRMDHSHTTMLAHKYTADASAGRKRAIADAVCLALEIHAQLEEEIFYPALREVAGSDEVLAKSEPEHDEMRRLIEQLRRADPATPQHAEIFHALMRCVMHHVADEEAVLLPMAETLLADRLSELGGKMTWRRLQLAAPHAGQLAVDHARTWPTGTLLLIGGLLAATYLAGRRLPRRHV